MANLLERVEELHRRVTELEQRLPKGIPVVTQPSDDWKAMSRATLVPYVDPLLEDAMALIERLAAGTWQTSDLGLPRDVRGFLARARVAKAVP